jgi:hypothetical protein
MKKFFSTNYSLTGASIFIFHPQLTENSILGIIESVFIFLITLTIFSKNDKFIFLVCRFDQFLLDIQFTGNEVLDQL